MTMSMQNWVFALLAVSTIGLLIMAIRITVAGKAVKAADAGLLIPVLIGLVYDNTMLAIGSSIGEGTLLQTLSYPRYMLHGLFTPLLVMFVALAADRMGVPGYRSRERLTLWGAVVFAAIWIGLVGELDLSLTPELANGVLAYKHLGGGPPIAEIITVVSLLIIGGTMQRYVRWPWVFFGALQMFVVATFYASNTLVSNIGELVLLSCMVATAAEAVQRTRAEREAKRADAFARRAARTEPATKA